MAEQDNYKESFSSNSHASNLSNRKTVSMNSAHRTESQLAEYELKYSDDDLEDLSMKLSDLENQELDNLSSLISTKKEKKPFFKDLLNAVIQGSIDYVNSITDVSDQIETLKDSSDVKRVRNEVIAKKKNSAFYEDEPCALKRTISEAQKSPFDKTGICSTEGMSSKGVERLGRYVNAYSQRTKTLTLISTGENNVNRKDFKVNAESLSGIESYRFGPIVAPTPISELKSLFDKDVASGKCDASNVSSWIRKHNYDKMDKQLMDIFGFKTKAEARKFRKENNLTPHEGPNGICLVPTDVHDSVSHNGYATKAKEVLSGKMTEQDMAKLIRDEKIQICKHELKQRGTRFAKGVLLSLVKDTAVFSIGVIGKEAYTVFNQDKGNFVEKVKVLMKIVWGKIKTKVLDLIKQIKSGFVGNIINEILTALNDFIFKTAKNIFRIIRMMWKSLYNALSTIFSSNATWGERIFEASKILAAGAVGVLGVTLNELIEKCLTNIGIPFASIFSDIASGLIGGVLSAVMLLMFDKARQLIFDNRHLLQTVNVEQRIMEIRDAKMYVSVLATDIYFNDAIQRFALVLNDINQTRAEVLNNIRQTRELLGSDSTEQILSDNDKLLKFDF